jgi:trans-aconitate methyltransferase
MDVEIPEVRAYYDRNVADKLRDFVEGNARIERAWQTLTRWAPGQPGSILEVGCGVGHITARLKARWPDAEVVGVDVSPHSIEIARELFGPQGVRFVEGPLTADRTPGPWDLIVLMDVYEHIAASERRDLHAALAGMVHEPTRIVLTFPTPRAQAWSRICHPETIQPVEEDVTVSTIASLANDVGMSVLSYEEVDVWHEGDYAHAVLGCRAQIGQPVHPEPRRAVISKIRRRQRLAFVHERLGKSEPRA